MEGIDYAFAPVGGAVRLLGATVSELRSHHHGGGRLGDLCPAIKRILDEEDHVCDLRPLLPDAGLVFRAMFKTSPDAPRGQARGA